MDILAVYERALKLGLGKYKDAPAQYHRSFAAAVAQLCCDNPEVPLNIREVYLTSLLKLSKGPTCREGAAIWAAYSKGDYVLSKHEGLTAFYTDPRFKRPGSWEFKEAVNHCEIYCYGPITKLHLQVYLTDPCFDDSFSDLKQLKKLKSSDH